MEDRITSDTPNPAEPVMSIRFASPFEVRCVDCHGNLDRHQPDDDRADRLLGTCPDCGSWHLIDEDNGVLYRLPDLWGRRRQRKV